MAIFALTGILINIETIETVWKGKGSENEKGA